MLHIIYSSHGDKLKNHRSVSAWTEQEQGWWEKHSCTYVVCCITRKQTWTFWVQSLVLSYIYALYQLNISMLALLLSVS